MTMGAPDPESFSQAFHEGVKGWSLGQWFVVVLAISVVVTVVSALVRQL